MTVPQRTQDLREALAASELRAEGLQARLVATRGMIDAISEAIYVQDGLGRFLDVNEGAARMYGHPRSFFLGKTPEVLSAPGRNDLEGLAGLIGRALNGEPQQFEFWGLKHDGSTFPKVVRLYPGTYLGQKVVIAVAQDISDQKRAELTQKATYHIAEAALAARDTQDLFERIHAIVRGLLPAENLYIARWDPPSDLVSFPYWVDQVDPVPAPRRLGHGLTEYILRTGKPLLIDSKTLLDLQKSGEIEPSGTLSRDWLGVPLHNEAGVFGALVVQSYDGRYRYTHADCELLAFVSAQVALAIERTKAQAEQRVVTTAMDCAADPIYGINAAGRFLFVNQAACASTGYSREEFQQLNIWDIATRIHPEAWPGRWDEVRTGGSIRMETHHQRKDGTVFPVEISSHFLTSEGREMVFTHARDISSRKAAEDALRASEDKFSKTFQASPDAININRLDGTYLDVNPAFTQMSGWSREETIGRTTLELGLWANLEDRERMQRMIQAQGHFVGLEAAFRMKDGSLRTGLVSGSLIQVGEETCLLSITRDITERKEAEAAIRYNEDKFSRAFHGSPDAINITRLSDGTYLDVSEGFEKVTGWTKAEAVGRTSVGLNIWVDPQDRQQIVELIRSHGEYTGQEISFRRKDGSILTGLMSGKVMDVDGVPCLLSVTRDITDRKTAESALRLAEQRLRTVLANSQAIIYQLDREGRFLLSEGLGLSSLGLRPEQVVGQSALELYRDDLETVAQIQDALNGLTSRQITRAGGRLFDNNLTPVFDAQGRVESVIGIATDVTERQQMEEALRQSQKLESLGILAGGIAHDFNNLLTVVLGNLNLAQMHLPEQAAAQPYLAKMEATVLRATELTKQMLAYSGRGHFQVEPRDLNQIVREVTHLLEVSISKKIHLRFELEPNLPAIQADAAQIQQVVMNLVTNASDAIGNQEGFIHLSTSLVHLDEGELRSSYRAESLTAGPYVLLEVADSGIGMPPEVLSRIFDPFFTTKAAGRGLGLSAMLGILRGHSAGLRIHSEVGRGSSFRLCFPASLARPTLSAPDIQGALSHPLRGRVLLVDDEDLILQTIGSALTTFGLEVLTAKDGVEALEQFRQASPRPDLVLMDLTMPRMDGREAFQAMHDLDPSIPVVLSSGYTEGDSLQTLSGQDPAGFIQKPYQIKELRLLIQRVLRD
jgi:PAS domain S-box-containing protein